jgi:hypothetical protein
VVSRLNETTQAELQRQKRFHCPRCPRRVQQRVRSLTRSFRVGSHRLLFSIVSLFPRPLLQFIRQPVSSQQALKEMVNHDDDLNSVRNRLREIQDDHTRVLEAIYDLHAREYHQFARTQYWLREDKPSGEPSQQEGQEPHARAQLDVSLDVSICAAFFVTDILC